MLAASVDGPRVAGVGLHPQRAELHGLADILVEIDDAAGDLVEAGEARLLVGDLVAGGSVTTSSPGCSVAGDLRHALGLALARRQPGSALRRRRVGDAGLAGLRRLHRDARLGIWRNDGRAGRRRQRLRLHAAGRRHALPRRRPVRGRQQPAARQFRHFLVVVGHLSAGLMPRGMAPGGRGARIGKDIADLRARRRRKRDRGGGHQGRKTSQGNGSKHLRGFKRRIGLAT